MSNSLSTNKSQDVLDLFFKDLQLDPQVTDNNPNLVSREELDRCFGAFPLGTGISEQDMLAYTSDHACDSFTYLDVAEQKIIIRLLHPYFFPINQEKTKLSSELLHPMQKSSNANVGHGRLGDVLVQHNGSPLDRDEEPEKPIVTAVHDIFDELECDPASRDDLYSCTSGTVVISSTGESGELLINEDDSRRIIVRGVEDRSDYVILECGATVVRKDIDDDPLETNCEKLGYTKE